PCRFIYTRRRRIVATAGRGALRNRAASSTLPGPCRWRSPAARPTAPDTGRKSNVGHGVAHGEPRPGTGREGPRLGRGDHGRGRSRRELAANSRTAAGAAAPGAAVSPAAATLGRRGGDRTGRLSRGDRGDRAP